VSAAAAHVAPDLAREIEQFLYREARLLDTGRFEEWLELFAPDGVYWVPSRPGQTDPLAVASLFYEDRAILAMRVQRLLQHRAHVLAPIPRTTHLLGNIALMADDSASGEHGVECAFIMVEHREDRQRIYSGRCLHRLRRLDGAWRIALKRVELVDCDGVHSALTIPF